jgi:hypothetical protein
MSYQPANTLWTVEQPCGCIHLRRSGAYGYQTVSRNRERCDRTCQAAS